MLCTQRIAITIVERHKGYLCNRTGIGIKIYLFLALLLGNIHSYMFIHVC